MKRRRDHTVISGKDSPAIDIYISIFVVHPVLFLAVYTPFLLYLVYKYTHIEPADRELTISTRSVTYNSSLWSILVSVL